MNDLVKNAFSPRRDEFSDEYTGQRRQYSDIEEQLSAQQDGAGLIVEEVWQNDHDIKIPEELQKDLDSGAAAVLYWRALIMPVRPKRVSSGGLVLPEESIRDAQYLTYIGRVVALGPLWCKGTQFDEYQGQLPQLKPGDWVIYGRHAGQRVEYKGVKMLLVNDDEKLMKIASPDGWRIYA